MAKQTAQSGKAAPNLSPEMRKWLAANKKKFADAKKKAKAAPDFTNLEPGSYIARTVKFGLNSDGKRFETAWIVVAGDHLGEQQYNSIPLEEDWGPEAVMRVLKSYDLLDEIEDDFSNIEEVCAPIVEARQGVKLSIAANKNNPDFVYCNVRKLLDDDQMSEVEEEIPDADDGADASSGKKTEPAASESEAPAVGETVTVTDPEDEDETIEVKVLTVDEDEETFTAKVGKKKVEFSFDDIQSEDDPDGSEADFVPEKGDTVIVTDEDEDGEEGTVVSVNEKEETAKVKVGKKVRTISFDDIQAAGVPIEEGMTVRIEVDGKTVEGTVTNVDEDEDEVTVEYKKGKKTVETVVSSDDVEIVDEE